MRTTDYDDLRLVYAITDPAHTSVVYVGETDRARDPRARYRSHIDSRKKIGKVELESLVFVHVMVTEYMVLDAFEHDTGSMPPLNMRKSQRDPPRKRNDLDALAAHLKITREELLARLNSEEAEREEEDIVVTLLNGPSYRPEEPVAERLWRRRQRP